MVDRTGGVATVQSKTATCILYLEVLDFIRDDYIQLLYNHTIIMIYISDTGVPNIRTV